MTVATVTAAAPALAPNGVPVVQASAVALAARSTLVLHAVEPPPVSTLFDPALTPVLANLSTAVYRQLLASFQDPQQQEVIGDFFQRGIAGVLKKQATSRLTSPDQTQILDDFFEGGVFQSEAHRFLQLFTDPDQHQFISDLVTGGLVQVLRNRLLDAATTPEARQAIASFFPDEVTDYRGGPIAVVQRRLIAAAKGNPVVIGLVNAILENPLVVTVQHLLGGGPLIGTPLHELPPITPDAAVAAPHTVTLAKSTSRVAQKTAQLDQDPPDEKPTTPSKATTPTPTTHAPEAAAEATSLNESGTTAGTTVSTDAMKTGNKVEPAGTTAAARPKPGDEDPKSAGTVSDPTHAPDTATADTADTKSSTPGGDE